MDSIRCSVTEADMSVKAVATSVVVAAVESSVAEVDVAMVVAGDGATTVMRAALLPVVVAVRRSKNYGFGDGLNNVAGDTF